MRVSWLLGAVWVVCRRVVDRDLLLCDSGRGRAIVVRDAAQTASGRWAEVPDGRVTTRTCDRGGLWGESRRGDLDPRLADT